MSFLAQAAPGASSFMPHGMCYLWQPELLWLHVASDFLTGVAYYAIPPSLLVLVVRARREVPEGAGYLTRRLPHEWMFIAFGLFIVACGTTHFFAAWNVWNADYWSAGGVKAVTALASLGTAIALPPLIPRALRLVRDARTSEIHHRRLMEANEELRDLNERLREMTEMRTRFFANVSHELRTPLALIVGPVSRGLEKDLPEDLREDLEMVRRNAWLLQKRVDDLLDLARTDAGQATARPESLDLAEIVRLTAGRFSSAAWGRELDLQLEVPDTLPALLDGNKFERIVDNLLSNALKFTPQEGIVRVRLGTEGETILLEVEDNGPGISEDQRQRIFERFRQLDASTRRETGGVGLGLAIVRDFSRLEGGDVRVGRSSLGGAHFEVRLPWRTPEAEPARTWAGSATVAAEVAGEAAAADAPPAADRVPSGTAPRVLVVEDNPEMRRLARRILESEFECAVADSGASALTMLDRWTPEVVVSDIMMPVMDGFELLREMRARPDLHDTPVLVLSALADRDVHARMLREGAQDYITKPFAPEELRARVSNLVSMRRARDTLRRELNSRDVDVHRLAEELARRRQALSKALEEVSTARDRADAANEAKTSFLAVMSHELRTPLNAILGYADLLDLGLHGALSPTQKEHVDRVRMSARHLLRTIEDILLFARAEPQTRPAFPQPVRIAELLDEVVGMVRPEAERKGLMLTVVADPVEVITDREHLVHVVTNLVSNAVKFTREGRVEVRGTVDADELRIEVEDTGPGIAPQDLERIFEPFWQADQSNTRASGGAGLGLSIALRLARQLDGDIEVAAGEEGGSRFVFRMPLSEADRAA